MDIGLFLGQQDHALWQCITFHPNNFFQLRLCQHSQRSQVGSICRIQLRSSDI